MAKHKNKAVRNLAIITLAVFCLFLVTTAQPVESIVQLIVIAVLGTVLLAQYIYYNFFFTAEAPDPGATLETYLAIYYNKVLDSFIALNSELANMIETFPPTKYFFARKAEFTAMTWVNESVFPSFKVLNSSGVLPQMANITFGYLSGINAVFNGLSNETAHYFINEFGDLAVKSDSNDTISGLNARYCYFLTAQEKSYWHYISTGDHNDGGLGTSQGFSLISNGSYLFVELKEYETSYLNYFTSNIQVIFNTTDGSNNPNTGNNSIVFTFDLDLGSGDSIQPILIPTGYWNVSMDLNVTTFSAQNADNIGVQVGAIYSTNAYVYNQSASSVMPSRTDYNEGHFVTYNTGDIYAIFNGASVFQRITRNLQFFNGADIIETLSCNFTSISGFIDALNEVVYAANLNAEIYHTTLRNLGYDDISEIPPDYFLAWVDGLITMSSNENFTYDELLNLYYAYLQGLANLFNSTNYQTANWSVPLANWTWANILVNGTLYNSTHANITEGWLYFSMPNEEVHFNVGENTTFTDPGWCFNTNTSRLYQYQAGYYVAVNNLTINGIYGLNGTITPYTIDIIVNPPSTPDEPHATGSGGGGGSSLGIILLIVIAAIILLSRGNSGSDNPVNIIMPKSKSSKATQSSHKIPSFFYFNPELKIGG